MDTNKEIRVNPDKIHLQSIRPLTDSINIDPSVVEPTLIKYDVNFEVGSGLSIDNNAVKVLIKATFKAMDEHDNAIGIDGAYSCEFILTIDNLVDFIVKDQNDDGLVVLHGAMAGSILGICYSTFRGIVFSRSKCVLNTGILLPIVDPLKLNTIKALAPDKSTEQ
ncbi:MAG: hypothetical protein K9G49_10080 [Taibaiella sp.]|nr:hypothetical protein [Taibaiella sp.]